MKLLISPFLVSLLLMIKSQAMVQGKLQDRETADLIQKRPQINRSATIQITPFINPSFSPLKMKTRPITAHDNNKTNLTNSLKKSYCFRRVFNHTAGQSMDLQEFTKVKEKFVEEFSKKDKGKKSKLFSAFWENETLNGNLKKQNDLHQILQVDSRPINLQGQSRRIQSFQSFLECKRRMELKKKNQAPSRNIMDPKASLNQYIEVYGLRKCVQSKQLDKDAQGKERASSQYKENFKKYMEKLMQNNPEVDKAARPQSSINIISAIKCCKFISSSKRLDKYEERKGCKNNKKYSNNATISRGEEERRIQKNRALFDVSGWRGGEDDENDLLFINFK